MQAGKYFLHLTRLTALIVLSLYSYFLYANSQEDFRTICAIFTEAKNSSFTNEQLNAYIESNVKSRVSNEDALKAYTLMFHVDLEERYPIFKKSAEYSTGKEWNCSAMKQITSK